MRGHVQALTQRIRGSGSCGGWGPLLDFVRRRGGTGVGVTLSSAQAAASERQQGLLRARCWTTIGLCSRKPDERTRRNSSLLLGLRSLRGNAPSRSRGPLRGLENYPGRGLTWRCSCQSSPAASSASWMCCHAAPPDSSSRMRTCPRSSGICVPLPRCLATAASSSSARLPGRITWTTIAVSGTRPIVVAGHRHTPPEPPGFRALGQEPRSQPECVATGGQRPSAQCGRSVL